MELQYKWYNGWAVGVGSPDDPLAKYCNRPVLRCSCCVKLVTVTELQQPFYGQLFAVPSGSPLNAIKPVNFPINANNGLGSGCLD